MVYGGYMEGISMVYVWYILKRLINKLDINKSLAIYPPYTIDIP